MADIRISTDNTDLIMEGVKFILKPEYIEFSIGKLMIDGIENKLVITLILFFFILTITHIVLWFFNKKLRMILSFLISITLSTLFLIGTLMPMEIKEFRTVKSEYNSTDDINFILETSKKGYYYIFTQKANSKEMKLIYPNRLSKDNIIQADTKIIIGTFRVKDYVGTEKVRLTLSNIPIEEYSNIINSDKQLIHQNRYTKELGFKMPNINVSEEFNKSSSNINSKGVNIVQRVIYIPINYKNRITIDTKSRYFKEQENIDMDIESKESGYAHIFEATPTKNIKKIAKGKLYDLEFRTNIEAKRPMGKHTAIVIYTKEDEEIKATDFKIEKEVVKGEAIYNLVFKNSKKYTYDIEEFEVTP